MSDMNVFSFSPYGHIHFSVEVRERDRKIISQTPGKGNPGNWWLGVGDP